MKLVKILLASTFALATASTFAAKADHAQEQDKVVVSTQESPSTTTSPESAAGQPTSAQPGSENAAEAQGQPAQPAQ